MVLGTLRLFRACALDDLLWADLATHYPFAAPYAERDQHGRQRLTLFRQLVLQILAAIQAAHTLQDTVLD